MRKMNLSLLLVLFIILVAFFSSHPSTPSSDSSFTTNAIVSHNIPRIQNALTLQKNNVFTCTFDSVTKKVYCFGGTDSVCTLSSYTCAGMVYDAIFSFDPISSAINIKSAKLPSPRQDLSCVFSSATNKIYCFSKKDIFEYDPVTDIVRTVNAKLPYTKSLRDACVESSVTKNIYCFIDADSPLSKVVPVEYNPLTDTIRTFASYNTFNPPFNGHIVFNAFSCTESSVTKKIYCFGGQDSDHFFPNTVDYIYEIDVTYTSLGAIYISRLQTRLPSPRSFLSCREHTQLKKIYCFGGLRSIVSYPSLDPAIQYYLSTDDIVEFDPATKRISLRRERVPYTIHSSACSNELSTNHIYCFGGADYLTATSFRKIFAYS